MVHRYTEQNTVWSNKILNNQKSIDPIMFKMVNQQTKIVEKQLNQSPPKWCHLLPSVCVKIFFHFLIWPIYNQWEVLNFNITEPIGALPIQCNPSNSPWRHPSSLILTDFIPYSSLVIRWSFIQHKELHIAVLILSISTCIGTNITSATCLPSTPS